MQLFVFRNRTRPANMHIIFRVEWNWMMHVTTVLQTNLSTIYLQPLQKNYNNKKEKKNKTKKPRKLLACSHRTQWKTLHSFIFFSVCSFQDWSMWSVRLSDRRKKKVTFHNWVSNHSDWQPFLHIPTSPPKSKEKKKIRKSFSHSHWWQDMVKNWMQALYSHSIHWADVL